MGDLVRKDNADIVSALVTKGDLSGLSAADRVRYYNAFCDHLGLDPLTQPFQLLNLQGKMILYANKTASEQLRKANGVSVDEIAKEKIDDIYVVTVIGHDKTGRKDGATGAVNIKGMAGEALANAMMKAETKAKRRFTLSICGLGMLDETEVETIPHAKTVPLEPVYDVGPTPEAPVVDVTPEAPAGDVIEEDVGPAPRTYSGKRSAAKKAEAEGRTDDAAKLRDEAKAELFQAFGPAKDYRIAKRDDGTWTTIKITEVAKGAGVPDDQIAF